MFIKQETKIGVEKRIGPLRWKGARISIKGIFLGAYDFSNLYLSLMADMKVKQKYCLARWYQCQEQNLKVRLVQNVAPKFENYNNKL